MKDKVLLEACENCHQVNIEEQYFDLEQETWKLICLMKVHVH